MSTWPPGRSARACRSESVSPSPPSGWIGWITARGSCAATARWPRARSGRRSRRRATNNLDNLTAIIDVNRLGQTGPTRYEWDLDLYADRIRSFGWHAIEIDGHDVEAVDRAYAEAVATTGKPTAIVARTIKGKGVSWEENKNGYPRQAS